MAGKKAKCKKCGTSFRIPGGDAPTGDSVSEGQMLSAMDLPVPSSATDPFDFDSPAAPKPVPAPKAVAAPPAKPAVKLPPPGKPAAKPPKVEDEVPAATPVEDEAPVSDPLSFDDDEQLPAVSADAAFSFDNQSSASPAPRSKSRSKSQLLAKDDPEPAKSSKRGSYRSNSGGGGIGKLLIASVVFALIVGAVVGGVLIYLNSKDKPDQVNNEKKEPPPTPPIEAPPVPKSDGKGVEPSTPKGGEKTNPKKESGGEKTNPKKEPGGKKTPGANSGAMLGLAPGRTIAFVPMATKRENVGEPTNRLAIVPTLPGKVDASFALTRKVFPPLKQQIDIGVLWQTDPGFQNRGEKLLLGIYSPQTGRQQNQVAFEGDGSPDPACDLSVSADLFAHAHTLDGKINVWNTRDGAKMVDGLSPFSDKKDLKLAAAYLTEPPDTLVAVSTSGVVRAFKLPGKEPMGEYIPTKVSSKPLVAGKTITPGPGRQSVVYAIGGTIYAVSVTPSVGGQVVAELGGDVGRSFGLAASGGQKLLYAFETDSDGKKEKAVMEVRGDGSHVFYRWPEKDAGEPTVAGWVGDDLAMIGTDRGACVWFEAEGKEFKPIGLARTPGDKARHVASDGHWTLLPDPADPKKCVLVEFAKPQSGIVGVLDNAKLIPTVMLTDKSLEK